MYVCIRKERETECPRKSSGKTSPAKAVAVVHVRAHIRTKRSRCISRHLLYRHIYM